MQVCSQLSVVGPVLMSHLSHAVVVVQEADVLLLDHLDEGGQGPGQLAAPVNEAVNAVLYIKPVFKITDPAAT